MKIVTPVRTLRVPVERGRNVIELDDGVAYVMHDVEADGGRQAGAFAAVGAVPEHPRPFRREEAACARIVVPFIGGLGDALSMQPVLRAMREAAPRRHITVATTPGPAEVFALLDVVDEILPYPLTLDAWRTFDAYVTMEAVAGTQQPGRPLPQTFAHALGLDLPHASIGITAPPETPLARGVLPDGPLIGLAVDSSGAPRAYPLASIVALATRLKDAGATCVLLGERSGGNDSATGVVDLRGRTTSVLSLAAHVAALDVVVAHDSFIMHLAASMGVPTVALFAPTASAHARPYASATPLTSDTPCAPCHTALGACPRGHARCMAWDAPAVSPDAVAEEVVALLSGTRLPVLGATG